jgi:hypothetical protein
MTKRGLWRRASGNAQERLDRARQLQQRKGAVFLFLNRSWQRVSDREMESVPV